MLPLIVCNVSHDSLTEKSCGNKKTEKKNPAYLVFNIRHHRQCNIKLDKGGHTFLL